MKKNGVLLMAIILLLLYNYKVVFGHSDTVCEPEATADPCCVPGAIADAKKAIDSNNVKYVLKWVTSDGEKEIKDAFDLVTKVRILSPEARELSDKYFSKTVVRLHKRYDFPIPSVLAGIFFITSVLFGVLYFTKK
jgi:hypothetical protein